VSNTEPPRRHPSYIRLITQRRFGTLILTRVFAITGDSIRALALAVLVYGLTHSPMLSAVAYSIAFIPQLLGSSFLGTLADWLPPRLLLTVLYAVDAATGIVIGALRPPVAVSLVLVAVVALVTPLHLGTSARLVADVLTGDDYVLGRAVWCSAPLAAQLAGNGIAAVLLLAVGSARTILISGGLQLCAVAVIRLGLPKLPRNAAPEPAPARPRLRSTFADSWSQNLDLLRGSRVRQILLAKWIPPGLVIGAEALIVAYAGRHSFPASAPGILLACLCAGTMVSNLIFGRVTTPSVRDWLTVAFTVVAGLPLLAFLVDPPLVVSAVLLTAAGVGLCYDLGLELRFVDAVPEDRRGLAFSMRSTGLMSAQGIGPLVFGALAQVMPVGDVMALCGGLTVLVGTALVVRALRPASQPAPARPEAPGAANGLTIVDGPTECNCPGGCGQGQPAAASPGEYAKDTVR